MILFRLNATDDDKYNPMFNGKMDRIEKSADAHDHYTDELEHVQCAPNF